MKILAINASPNRNGSTAKLIDLIVKSCGKSGAECEIVHLEDYLIESCGQCRKCLHAGECYLDDDYLHLKAKILESDGIIIGSPYYNSKPVDSIKCFVERIFISDAYAGLFDKKYLIGISTSAVNDCRMVAGYCASLGGAAILGGGTVSGLLNESLVTNDGVRDIQSDADIIKSAEILAKRFIEDIKLMRLSNAHNMLKLILMKRQKPYIQKLRRRKYCIGR